MTGAGEPARPIFFDAAQLFFFPVRHHSPACAWQLRRAIRDIRPGRILIEAPVGFEPFIPLLADARTRPPVAIVAMGQGASRGLSYYPFCAHSPEYIAIRDGLSAGAEIGFIDLPALHPAMVGRRDAESESQPVSLVREHRLDSSAYVRALCARTGARDGATLWDNLFEAQIAVQDWRRYFASVALYCAHIRAATPAEEMQADGTLAREAQMAACIAAARADARGPILVVTGGFHTPALVEAMEHGAAATPVAAGSDARSYLVRYGFQQLDRLNGYSAGLPLPGYYDRVWSTLETGEAGLGNLATDLVLGFADHLRAHEPSLRLPVPAMRSAIELAHRLAELRDLPHPGRSELLDAIQSTCIKDAIAFGLSPIGNAFASFLRGFRIGDVSPDAGLPPIVEAARGRARALGFVLEDGVPRTRELDLHRKARHRDASHFLHAMDMLGARFAHRESGPDPLVTHRAQIMIERWRYAWSPNVEARLIDCAADGDTVALACAAVLHRRRLELVQNGQGANAAAAAELLLAAHQAGLVDHLGVVAGWVDEAITADIDLQSLTRCLLVIAGMNGAEDAVPGLLNACYRRILFILPDLRTAPDTQIRPLTSAIAELAQLLADKDNRPAGLDIDLFRERVGEVLAARLPGPLDGAMSAVAGMFGVLDIAAIEARTRAALAGAYETPAERIGVIAGLLAVAPHFFLNSDGLLAAADAFVAGLSDEEFLALLPDLRLAFTGLNPEEVDRFSAWLANLYGVDKRAASDAATVPDAELVENMRLSARLEARWREDGLAAWMGLS